jgi:hypothetical protein
VTRWPRPRLLAASTEPATTEENSTMPTTATSPPNAAVDDKIAELRALVEAVAVEAAADPSALADNLKAWRRRETERQDRIMAAEQKTRALGEYGELIDTPAMDVVRAYTERTAGARQLLAYPVEHRQYKDPGALNGSNGLARALREWWDAILTAARALPDNPDAYRWQDSELAAWFHARDATVDCFILWREGGDVQRPELDNDGRLPTGATYGIHRIGS